MTIYSNALRGTVTEIPAPSHSLDSLIHIPIGENQALFQVAGRIYDLKLDP